MTDEQIMELAVSRACQLARSHQIVPARAVIWTIQLRALARFRRANGSEEWAAAGKLLARNRELGILGYLAIGCPAGPVKLAAAPLRATSQDLTPIVPWADLRRTYFRTDQWLQGANDGWTHGARVPVTLEDPEEASNYRRGLKVGALAWRRVVELDIAGMVAKMRRV